MLPRAQLSALPPLRDRIKPGVRVLFVGINPGVRSAETGHHFAGYSNRFWKLLFAAGLVPTPIIYEDDDRLPEFGFGITNICARATPGIDTLLPEEYVVGRLKLRRKILRYKPQVVAMVGVTVFRAMFPERKGAVKLGLQPEKIGDTAVFVLPNPSGRNANFTYAEMLAAFRALRRYTHSLARDQSSDVAAFRQRARVGPRVAHEATRDHEHRPCCRWLSATSPNPGAVRARRDGSRFHRERNARRTSAACSLGPEPQSVAHPRSLRTPFPAPKTTR